MFPDYSVLRRWRLPTLFGDRALGMRFQRTDHVEWSIRFEGAGHERVEIPCAEFSALQVTAGTKPFGAGTVQRFVNREYKQSELTLLAFAAGFDVREKYVVNYTLPDFGEADLIGGKGSLPGHPVVPPATVPVESEVNVRAGFESRVEQHKNRAEPEVDYVQDFLKFVIPKSPALCPYSFDEVEKEMLKTPLQNARYNDDVRFAANQKDKTVKVFCKVEPVNDGMENAKPARLIMPTSQKMLAGMARYAIPAKKWLSDNTKWCCVGLSPSALAERVTEFCGSRDYVETDFTKMDARISPHLREVYRQFLLRLFRRSCREDITRILDMHIDAQLRIPHVGKRKSGTMNLSGSADTTLLNTVVNAYCDYLACRLAKLRPDEVVIGPKYGDDGISRAGIDFEGVCQQTGCKIKVTECESGGPVSFLSRVYPAPRSEYGSYACWQRALSRIPVTTNPNSIVGFALKVRGYLVTDSKSPVIGAVLRAYNRIYQLDKVDVNGKYARPDEVWRFVDGPYPEVGPIGRLVAEAEFEKMFGVTLGQFESSVDAAKTIADLEAICLVQSMSNLGVDPVKPKGLQRVSSPLREEQH
jgi:hypothetical protein